MANEGSLRIIASFKKSSKGIDFKFDSGTIQFDIAGDAVHDTHQTVAQAAEELLSLGDAGVGGLCIVHNLDATNYVELRGATGIADTLRILAGDAQCFRITGDSTTPYVLANTADVRMRVIVFEL